MDLCKHLAVFLTDFPADTLADPKSIDFHFWTTLIEDALRATGAEAILWIVPEEGRSGAIVLNNGMLENCSTKFATAIRLMKEQYANEPKLVGALVLVRGDDYEFIPLWNPPFLSLC